MFERNSILVEAHGGAVGGHYAGKATTQKILRARLWCLTLHKDSKAYCRACDTCQMIGRPLHMDELLLNPQTLKPFEKWVIDFVGPIQPLGKKTGVWYIITMTDYLTRWVEAQLVKDCTTMTPTECILSILRMVAFTGMTDRKTMEERLMQLAELEEYRFIVGFHQQVQKERKKAWHDRHIKLRTFKVNALVLLYDNEFDKFPGKFWMH
eukprot:PITA_08615